MLEKVLQMIDFHKEQLEKYERELEAIQSRMANNPISELVGLAFNKGNTYISFEEIAHNNLYITIYTLCEYEIEVETLKVDISLIVFSKKGDFNFLADEFEFLADGVEFTGYKEVDRSVIDTIIEYGIELDEKLEELNDYSKSKILELKNRL